MLGNKEFVILNSHIALLAAIFLMIKPYWNTLYQWVAAFIN